MVPFLAVMTFCAVLFDAGRAMAAEIKLLDPRGMRAALTELAPQFERATGHRVILDLGISGPLKRRIDAGETFGIAILPSALIDDLTKQGKIAADTRAAFVRSGLGIGVRKGAAKPDIGSVDASKRTLLNAKSVGYEPEAEPGIQFLEVLDRLGIAQDMRPKLKAYLQIGWVASALEKGEVDMIVLSIGSILGNPAADLVGGFPRDVQRYVDFAAGVSATTKEPEATKALLGFLLSPTATSVFKAKGFERD
jgi:molybdate transport system substrate-binding protein